MLVTSARTKRSGPPPSLPVEGSEELSVSRLAAVLRGSFPQGLDEGQWQGDEEKLGPIHVNFLKTYWQNDAMPLPFARKAWQQAFPSCGKGQINSIVGKIADLKKYVTKKKHNSKTGVLMPAWVKDLLPYLQTRAPSAVSSGSAVASLKKAKAEDAPKAEGSRPSRVSNTGSAMASLKKAKVEYAPTGLASAEAGGPGQSSEAEELDDGKSILTVSSSAAPSTAVMSLASRSTTKRPSMNVGKKPAARTVKKKPGCIQGLRRNSWKASPSFGWVKATFATQKSYIQYKASLGDKMQLLVNCQGNFDHADVTRNLLDLVTAKSGLDKAMVLEERNKLLAK